jgi:hypothetical protein
VAGLRTIAVHHRGRLPDLDAPGRIATLRAVSPLVFCGALRYQPHMTDDSIEGLARKLAESLPQGLRSVRDDLEKNFRAVLRSGLAKLDLVTREEFEVQEAVLARTREKLQSLESRLAALEMPRPAARKKTGAKKAKKKPA